MMRADKMKRADEHMHKIAVKQLKHAQQDFELLVTSIKDYAIFMLDVYGNVTTWNTGAEAIKGYSADQIIGKNMEVFYTAEDRQKGEPQRNLENALKFGRFESEGLRVKKDGSTFYANIIFTALYDEESNLYGFAKVTRDITEKRKTEDSLRFLATIAENIQDPIISSDNDFFITRWNGAAEKLLEWTSEEVIGQLSSQVLNIFYPNETRTEIIIAYQRKGYWQGELIYHTRSGRPVDVLATSSQLKDAEGNITGNLTVVKDITQRKKVEKALNKLNEELEQRVKKRTEELFKSEMRFRSLIENSAEGISLLDAKSNVLYRSPSAYKILGNNPKENVISLAHSGNLENFQNKFAEALSKPGVPIPYQVNYLHAAGHHFWAEGTFTNLLHLDAVKAVVANFRDITQRKDLEVLLYKANELARIGGWEIDMIKNTVYWTAITKEIHETSDDYVPVLEAGINFYKQGKSRDLITEKIKEAIESGKAWDVELEIITAKNNERWVRAIGETEFANGKCIRVYGSFQDIDRRKRAEDQLVAREKRFRALVENNYDIITLIDASFKIIYRSPSVSRVMGFDQREMEALEGIDNVHPQDRERAAGIIREATTNPGKPISTIFRRRHKDGHYVWLEGVITNLLQDEEIKAFVTNFRDVTQRIESEEKIKNINIELEEKVLARTEQLRKVSEDMEAFSYSISHDLRAPLRGIVAFAKILDEDYGNKLDDEARRIIQVIIDNTLKMGNLIDDLLTFSKTTRYEITKTFIDMNAMVAGVVADLAPGPPTQHQIKWVIAQLPEAYGDKNTIRQVWINLISNAIKYSAKKSKPRVEISSVSYEDKITFSVKDNGVGFDEKYKNKLFKVFQRLHGANEFEGTGIGLAIVQKIISKHGGEVWVNAELDKGATFFFSLLKQ